MFNRKNKIIIKTEEQIEQIKLAADILSRTFGVLSEKITPGVSLKQLDEIAEEFIRDNGGIPAFKDYKQSADQPPYPGTLCLSVNDEVVHGIPRDLELKDGDIISIDCGVIYNGFYADSAYTFKVGNVSPEIEMLLEATYQALLAGIEKAKHNNRIGDISYAVQSVANKHGLGIVREMVGHGVGVKLHEPPEIPNYGRRGTGRKLQENMVIAIEPMLTLGRAKIFVDNDGWTIKTRDGSIAAHYEHTVLVTKNGGVPLTSFEHIENKIKT